MDANPVERYAEEEENSALEAQILRARRLGALKRAQRKVIQFFNSSQNGTIQLRNFYSDMPIARKHGATES